jgi:hypothetical protein
MVFDDRALAEGGFLYVAVFTDLDVVTVEG